MKVKVEIITGFLESGKTSFINAYASTFKEDDRPYIIYLEKGNKKIDDKYKHTYVKSLEEFEEVFEKIDTINNNHILIEHNGTIELKKISDILLKNKIRQKINFYGVYFVGNYENFNFILKNISEIILPFIQSSKILILNNYNRVDKEGRQKILEIIKEINLSGQIIEVSSLDNIESEIKRSRYFKPFKINEGIRGFIKGGNDDN